MGEAHVLRVVLVKPSKYGLDGAVERFRRGFMPNATVPHMVSMTPSREIRPDIHAKGTDYTADNVPERDTVVECGGRVAIVGDPKNHSATEFIARIGRKERP